MIQDYTTTGMNTSKDLLIASPVELSDRASLCFDGWHAFPAFIISWALSGKLLTLPHDNIPLESTTGYDSSLGVPLDGHDLVVDHLSLE